MSDWINIKLGDFVYFQRGHDLPKTKMVIGHIPVAGSNGVIGYHHKSTTEGPGITIGRSGNIGTPHYYQDNFWAHNTVLYIKEFNNNNPRFVYYFLKNIDLSIFNTGSAVPSINRNHIHSLQIKVPFLDEQKAIASVLSSLDNKIDLLHRQNKTLESMAETLFRQWFMEEAQEDWEEVSLQDVCIRITDGSHASPRSLDSGYAMASVKDMATWGINLNTCRKISLEDYNGLVESDCKAIKGDILIAKDGSYLKHVILLNEDIDAVLLSSIAMIRPNGKYDPILLTTYLKLKSTKEEMENIVTGAVIPRIVLKDFRSFTVKLPPQNLQQQASKQIRPLYEKCWYNCRQIKSLESLRDTLLPKLMSGDVRVKYEQ